MVNSVTMECERGFMSSNDIVPNFDDDSNESLKIRLQRVPNAKDCLLVFLNGYVDTYNSSFFQKKVGSLIEKGFIRLIFNCAALNYVSSTGIGSFTAFLKRVKPKGGDVVLLEVQPKVYEVFQLLGFSQFFQLKYSLSEALAFFQSNGSTSGQTTTFPKIFSCPICSKKLKATRMGRFRCAGCKAILAIDANAQVSLG